MGSSPAAIPQPSQQATPAQAAGTQGNVQAAARIEPTVPPLANNLTEFDGRTVVAILYQGVDFNRTDKLTGELTQKAGEPFDRDKVRQTTRRLFATGRYRNIAVRVETVPGGVNLIFAGIARYYVGKVSIVGVKQDRLASLLEYGTQLNPGTAFNSGALTAGTENVKRTLAQNGYYEPKINVETMPDDAGQQINVTYTIDVGPAARIGEVTITGNDPGISTAEFVKKGKLRNRTLLFHRPIKVGRDTTSNALSNLRSFFQKKDRLEATVSLQKSTYQPATKTLDYSFEVDQGPIVKVDVQGTKIAASRLRLLVPVYEEGTVDNDLLNEGTHNIKDFLQQKGYFDAEVAVNLTGEGTPREEILYTVKPGNKHRVVSVTIDGNKYFSTALLEENLRVQKGNAYMRSGKYSQALVAADQNSIQALYRANGFKNAKVTTKVVDSEEANPGKPVRVADISIAFTVVEGTQQTFGTVAINGVEAKDEAAVMPLLNAREGQPFSLITLSGDRDAMLAYYLSNGYDQAKVEVAQTVDPTDPSKTDVNFNVAPGKQVFVGRVLESGRHFTRQSVVDEQLRVHPEDPLDQSALLETQRNLYNLALFNEVNVATQNPTGDAEQKNVLVQLTEAKRWDVTYGFGFEVQTGVPSCGSFCTQQGTTKAQQGKAGVSPRVSADISRINLFGTDNSLSLHTSYGLLERIALLSFQDPHFRNNKKLALQISGGYSNVQNISTFKASTLQGDFRVTDRRTRKDTFIYDFQYRRVAVDPNSLAISSNLIPLLSQPVRVGGPGVTWLHDTRTPSPLDATKGSYSSVAEFYASSKLGSAVGFNRTDLSNSTYYQFGKSKSKYVFARQTRIGFIHAFGVNPNIPTSGNVTDTACGPDLIDLNASCNAVPLPERLYAGGATSDRGFPINGAGPRDLQTGFPVGGSAVFVNTFELRLPPPTLPYVGDSVSFVLFHDMGNVFYKVGDMFPSIARFHQPNEDTCRQVTNRTFGTCDFNYFSHALGLGARYRTPVGPIRVDLSYNLNPPIYPVIPTQTAPGVYVNGVQPYVGQGNHFNFFFSIGQSF